MAFDLLEASGKSFLDQPLDERRRALESFFDEEPRPGTATVARPPTDRGTALGWLERSGGALDGVIAKRLDLEYRSGERADDQGEAAAHG